MKNMFFFKEKKNVVTKRLFSLNPSLCVIGSSSPSREMSEENILEPRSDSTILLSFWTEEFA